MRITQDNEIKSELELEQYCIYLLMKIQDGKCFCGAELKKGYQIAHKRYGIDITLYDLALKCGACHAREHGIRSHTGTLRLC